MSNCEVGGVQWRKRDPLGKYNWVLNGLVAWTGRGERSEGISSPARFGSHRRCQREAARPCEGPIELQGPRPKWLAEGACRVWAGVS